MENYLGEWLKGALAESELFRVVDPKRVLMDMPMKEIRTRGIRLPAAAAGPAPEDLTSDLVQPDAKLWGSAWIHAEDVEIRAQICDRTGKQIASASVDMSRVLIPHAMFAKSSTPQKGSEQPIDECKTRKGLMLELTTNAGESPEFLEGEKVKFVLRTNRDAYVYLFNINPEGDVVALYPVEEKGDLTQKPPCGVIQSAGVPIVQPEDGCSYDIVVSEPFGKDRIWACASEVPLAIDPKLRGQWARGEGLIRNVRRVSEATDAGYAEAFLGVLTRPE